MPECGHAAGAIASLDAMPGTIDDGIFAQVTVNGVDSELIVHFHGDPDDLAASGDDLRALGLAHAGGAVPVRLHSLPGVRYRVDTANQTVEIDAAAGAMQTVELTPHPRMQALSDAAWGGVLNYAAYAERSFGRLDGGATMEARLFGPVGTFSHGMVARDRRRGPGLLLRRLETRYVLDDPARMRRLIVGDHIATDGTATGAVRAAGIQFSTRFALQPDLVTAPMPHLVGGSGVPSTVDVLVDGVRRSSQSAAAGTYTLSQTPMVNGAGQVSLVVHDILGRETVQTLSFYGTSELLRRGLEAFSGQAGLLRLDAFGPRDRYGDAFVSGVYRRGISDRLTVEARAVLARPIRQAGVTVSTKAGEFALVSVGADVATHRDGHGIQAVAAVRRDAGRLSFYANVQKAFGEFKTIAAVAGDPVTRFQAQIGGSLQSDRLGSFSISATSFRTRSYSSRLLAANWSRQIGPRLMLFGSVVGSRDVRSATVATLGVTMALSARSAATAQSIRDRNGWSGSAAWSEAPPLEGGIGYRTALSGGNATATRAIAGATMRGTAGEIGFDAALSDGRGSVRAFASGSAVWLGGTPRLAAHVGESFAVVNTVRPGVAVRVENRFAGKSGRDGRLLVPDLPGEAPTRIGIDLDALGIDYDAAMLERIVRPRGGTGTIVELPVRPIRTATVRLVDEAGQPLPLGSRVHRERGREDVVAYDGVVDLRDVTEQVSADVETPTGRCRALFRSDATEAVVCHAQ